MSRFNFSALREDTSNAKPYKFEQVPGAPALKCLPATGANKRYQSAMLKDMGKRKPGSRKRARLDPDLARQGNVEEAHRVAKYCVVGWDPAPLYEDGTLAEFSTDNVIAFLEELPDWMLLDFLNWIQEPLNFVGDGEEVDVDEEIDEEAAGNSSETISAGSSDVSETASA